ncbi:MAG: hypothetical protein AB8B74_07340 [Crocinitomicaceae bacterium]
MSDQKKYGTFAGVFTPSILTILGVIMYLRMGWVVGHAGWLVFAIIGIAHIISITTGLSISSISTDKKVGAGGVYYVLSRSLGLPIGGALGLTLFIATAFSIALYMVGFAEIFNSVFDFNLVEKGASGQFFVNNSNSFFNGWSETNLIRITGSIGLLCLAILALISTSIALKSQFLILGLIILSLVSIFMGSPAKATFFADNSASDVTVPFIEIFAVFFPAVTGFTAGIAMSGDLKNSKKSIPYGTMLSIGVGLLVYTVLALYLHSNFNTDTLKMNGKVMFESAYISEHFINFGVWGATLSSALGGILGGPRILQAMSVDKITPKFFARGVGKENEPRNALILTILIAEAGILIGELNLIAEIVSMFYLAAYGFINLSFFLESWASADFNPSFKVKKWIGLLGGIATFIIMFQLNMVAMFAAFLIIGFIYLYLNKKQISLGTGDIWQSVWSTVVKKGLRRMEAKSDHKRNWKPNILLFSTGHSERVKFIEFSKAVSGQTGIITNFDLIENTEASVLFPKHKQSVKDEDLEKFGVFGRQIEVQNEFKGIESIASTFGFSGMEPNTILMPWPGETKDPIWFTDMTRKLFDLDYNVLYLDYDKRWGFRKKEQIDLWWRSVGNTAELMLSLVKFISMSSDWAKANIRVLLVNDTNTENQLIEGRIQQVLDQFRVKASIRIIANNLDQTPIYELMKLQSADADLVFVGIPEVNEPKDFITQTNELVNTIGTTLLVKASTQFDETDLKVESIDIIPEANLELNTELAPLFETGDTNLNDAIGLTDECWDNVYREQLAKSLEKVENYHHQEVSKIEKRIAHFIDELKRSETESIWRNLDRLLVDANKIIEDDIQFQLPEVYQLLDTGITNYIFAKEESIYDLPKKVLINSRKNNLGQSTSSPKTIKYQKAVSRLWTSKGKTMLKTDLLEFGYQNFILIHQHKNKLHKAITGFIESVANQLDIKECIAQCENALTETLSCIDNSVLNLNQQTYNAIRQSDRNLLKTLGKILEKTSYRRELQERLPFLSRREEKEVNKALNNYSGYWQRNMVLFNLNFQSDIYLLQYACKAEATLVDITLKSEGSYLEQLKNNISVIKQDADKLADIVADKNLEGLHQFNPSVHQDVFFDLESTVQFVLDKLGDALELIPEEVELMTAQSVNNIRKAQDDSVATLNIQLDDIADYLTKINFYKPFKDLLSSYINQLKKTASVVLNGSFKLQEEIDASSKTKTVNSIAANIAKVQSECEEAMQTVDALHHTFIRELNALHHQLNEALNINKIVEQYEVLHPQAKLESRGRKLQGQVKQYQNRVTGFVHKLVTTILQKKETSEKIKHELKHQSIVSPISTYIAFTDSYNINPKTQLNLPYYYNQLFNSKYFTDTNTIEGRVQETAQIGAAIDRLHSGKSGCALVLGESLSGKTFFINHVLQVHLKGFDIYRLKSGSKLSKETNSIQKILQKATGKQQSIPAIMRDLKGRAVFIIDDIETWFLNTTSGSKLINDLNQLINTYGQSHTFILTGNLQSFKTLKTQTNINDSVISTILLKPLTSLEITKVIETRHQLGGMTYLYQDVKEQLISPSKRLKMMQRFFTMSKGNIGLALKYWIGSISNIDENKFTIEPISEPDLPSFPDETWQSILYQFQLHQKLSKKDLNKIYGDGNTEWINRYTNQLTKANLITNPEKDVFIMPSDIRYFIEKTYAK